MNEAPAAVHGQNAAAVLEAANAAREAVEEEINMCSFTYFRKRYSTKQQEI